jgi:hypothetical protein
VVFRVWGRRRWLLAAPVHLDASAVLGAPICPPFATRFGVLGSDWTLGCRLVLGDCPDCVVFADCELCQVNRGLAYLYGVSMGEKCT